MMPSCSRILVLAALAVGCSQRAPVAPVTLSDAPATTRPVEPPRPVGLPRPAAAEVKPYVLHLPGVAGTSIIDYTLREGLKTGGFDGVFEFFDWTCNDPGIPALHARRRNEEQAQILADKLTAQYRAHPDRPIYLTCHSGGSGPATWALERLPADVKVACFVMLAPALSPTYDLSKALSRVSGKAYCFYSQHDDLVLGTGTKLFGTIDGLRVEAAGKVGFTKPETADPEQYAKLVSKAHDAGWAKYGNIGGHVGVMRSRFVRAIVAPLMLGREATKEALEATVPKILPDVQWPK
jgi:hypothetical protein